MIVYTDIRVTIVYHVSTHIVPTSYPHQPSLDIGYLLIASTDVHRLKQNILDNSSNFNLIVSNNT